MMKATFFLLGNLENKALPNVQLLKQICHHLCFVAVHIYLYLLVIIPYIRLFALTKISLKVFSSLLTLTEDNI